MSSGSFARGDRPRSVPDPDGDRYDEMLQRYGAATRTYAVGGQHTSPPKAEGVGVTPRPRTDVDSVAAGLAHILDGPRAARRELEKGHTTRAVVEGATAAADLAWAGLAARGLIMGKVKLKPPFDWRTKPWEDGRGAREWMGDKGFLKKGQPGHHAIFPQNGWGKHVPDFIKNQMANIKPTETLIHTRIHGASRKYNLPRFGLLERYWHGTPTWWKAANGSALGHATQVASDHLPPADPVERLRPESQANRK